MGDGSLVVLLDKGPVPGRCMLLCHLLFVLLPTLHSDGSRRCACGVVSGREVWVCVG